MRVSVRIATLTFRIHSFVGTKDVDLKAVMVGPAFGVPEFAITLFLDITAQQKVAVDRVAYFAREDTLAAARGFDECRIALDRRRSVRGLFLFGSAATLGFLATSHCC